MKNERRHKVAGFRRQLGDLAPTADVLFHCFAAIVRVVPLLPYESAS